MHILYFYYQNYLTRGVVGQPGKLLGSGWGNWRILASIRASTKMLVFILFPQTPSLLEGKENSRIWFPREKPSDLCSNHSDPRAFFFWKKKKLRKKENYAGV